MPSITAKRKCPDLIFVKPRFDAYKGVSLQIREIFAASMNVHSAAIRLTTSSAVNINGIPLPPASV